MHAHVHAEKREREEEEVRSKMHRPVFVAEGRTDGRPWKTNGGWGDDGEKSKTTRSWRADTNEVEGDSDK